jgi:type IV pilus assembly protein PilA
MGPRDVDCARGARTLRRGRGFTLIELLIAIGILGVLAALTIYGVARHMMAAATAEAKDNVSAIARHASAAFERSAPPEGEARTTRSLCSSAEPVPAVAPKARKYRPDPGEGKDFATGSATAGWRCLGFALSDPIYFSYRYAQGGGYVGPLVHGPDPGPNGFEAAAQGDFDGDSVVSTFTRAGTITPKGELEVSTLFAVRDLE